MAGKTKGPRKFQITVAERAARKRAKKAEKARARQERAAEKIRIKASREAKRPANLQAEAERAERAKAKREAEAKAKAEAERKARIAEQAELIARRASQAREWIVLVMFRRGAHAVRVHNTSQPIPKGWREARNSKRARGTYPALRFGGWFGAERIAERTREALARSKRA